jgi:RHS repeat-associated protein
VWLGTTPVAVIEANTAYFIHPDHLDTPRVVTSQANTIVWRWDSDPFGTTPPNEDPDGDAQSFVLNLRFPGQYFDKETNLHYNYFRDYDPQTSKYLQPDTRSVGEHVELMFTRMSMPKLLRSIDIMVTPDVNAPPLELNPYAYVANDPLRWTDPTGEGIEWAVPAAIIGGTCFTMYCAKQAWNYCSAAYPALAGPENDRKRMKCAAQRLKFCVTFGMYIMDPIGQGAATTGEEIGRKTCKECEH